MEVADRIDTVGRTVGRITYHGSPQAPEGPARPNAANDTIRIGRCPLGSSPSRPPGWRFNRLDDRSVKTGSGLAGGDDADAGEAGRCEEVPVLALGERAGEEPARCSAFAR